MNLEENLEYESLEEDLIDKNKTFCSEYEDYDEYESLSNVENIWIRFQYAHKCKNIGLTKYFERWWSGRYKWCKK